MKNAALISIILSLAFPSYGQVLRFRGFEAVSKRDNDPPLKDSSWRKTDVVIVENFDKNKVQIYVKNTMDIDLIRLVNKEEDSTGTAIIYKGVDNYGEECNVVFISYNDTRGDHVGTLVLDYRKAEMRIIYRLKRD